MNTEIIKIAEIALESHYTRARALPYIKKLAENCKEENPTLSIRLIKLYDRRFTKSNEMYLLGEKQK